MNWPSSTVLPLALLSLGIAETPGAACGTGGGVRQPGAPCAGRSVMQERDLSFSIRSVRPRAIQPAQANPSDRRRPIVLGDGLNADAAIFVSPAVQEKEVSDANRR
jgi:hypothetical protein